MLHLTTETKIEEKLIYEKVTEQQNVHKIWRNKY